MKAIMRLFDWCDARLPISSVWKEHMAEYYAPKNFNFWYYFGSLALLVLVIQIVTGIYLTMHFKPDADLAFASLQYIRRDVPGGWFIADMHAVGASMFFIVIYLHMFRSLLYGSHHRPREMVWLIGMMIFVALMAEAFMGYLLPWGNMSYWGAQVIINLFDTIPWVGPIMSEWIRGDFVISDATLNRFFAFHVVAIPFIIVGLVFIHIVALHKVGSNNPDGIEIKENKGPDGIPVDGIPFHPYYTVKDIVGAVFFLIIFFAILFFAPEMGGWFLEPDNFVPANILTTPIEIKPLWYFTSFYSILRVVTDNLNYFIISLLFFGTILFVANLLVRRFNKSVRYATLIALILFFTVTYVLASQTVLNLFVVNLKTYLLGLSVVMSVLAVLAMMVQKSMSQRIKVLLSILGIFILCVLLHPSVFNAKLWGVIFMGLALVLFFFLPWLDRSPVKSIRYRGWMYRTALMLFALAFIVLGYLGTVPTTGTTFLIPNLWLAQAFFILYFAFFFLMPWYTRNDKTKPVPGRVTK